MPENRRGERLALALLRWQAQLGRKVTLRELAEGVARRVGRPPVTDVTVSRWMAGKSEPQLDEWFALCAELGQDAVGAYYLATGLTPESPARPTPRRSARSGD